MPIAADTTPEAPRGIRATLPADERPAASRTRRMLDATRSGVARHWRWAAVVLLLAVVSWPFSGLSPVSVDDANWMFGLDAAARFGIHFGNDFAWTYGPLGFLLLKPTLFYTDIALLRFAAQLLLQVALAAGIYCAARRSFAAPVAFVLAGVAISLVPERQVALALTLCVLAIVRDADRSRDRYARAFPALIGALAGFMLLDKLNGGVEAAVLGPIALATRASRRRADAVLFAGALLATLLAGWLATGQRLADLEPYVRYGIETVKGYPGAMGLADPGGAWHYWAALALAVAVATLAWGALRGADPRRRWGLGLVVAVFTYMAFKEGFIRHDTHPVAFMGAMLVVAVVLPVARSQRPFALLTAATAVVCFAAVLAPFSLLHGLDPVRHATALADQVKVLAVRDHRGAAKSRLKLALQSSAQMPEPVLRELRGRTVAFWPHSMAMMAYAYDLDWRPLPVLEGYGAYTPALDRLNADMLDSPRAPERLVRITPMGVMDGRDPTFDAPETELRILCDYRQVVQMGDYQVLARTASRCGRPQPFATVVARWGAPVRIPALVGARDVVVVRIAGAQPAGLERLKALWLRPDARFIHLDGQTFRLVSATAGDGLLLHVPPAADYGGPFRLGTDARTISVSRAGGQPGGTLRYAFERIPIAPLDRGR